jgi:hypothetical protein
LSRVLSRRARDLRRSLGDVGFARLALGPLPAAADDVGELATRDVGADDSGASGREGAGEIAGAVGNAGAGNAGAGSAGAGSAGAGAGAGAGSTGSEGTAGAGTGSGTDGSGSVCASPRGARTAARASDAAIAMIVTDQRFPVFQLVRGRITSP